MSEYIKLYVPRMVPTLSVGCAKDASTEIIRRLCYQEMCKFFSFAQRIESISVMTISPTVMFIRVHAMSYLFIYLRILLLICIDRIYLHHSLVFTCA